MKGKLAAANITQIINELKKISSLNKRKKDKYISKLEELHKLYINIEIDEKFKIQYNRMNEKGKEVPCNPFLKYKDRLRKKIK